MKNEPLAGKTHLDDAEQPVNHRRTVELALDEARALFDRGEVAASARVADLARIVEGMRAEYAAEARNDGLWQRVGVWTRWLHHAEANARKYENRLEVRIVVRYVTDSHPMGGR